MSRWVWLAWLALPVLLCYLPSPHPTPSSQPPASYLARAPSRLERISNLPHPILPDTTVVLLNWSRFNNVLLLVSHLCGPELKSLVAMIVVWNNRPDLNLQYKVLFFNTNLST